MPANATPSTPAPTLSPGSIVVMDTLGSHKGAGVRAAIEAMGASLLPLSPCGPDINLTGNAVAKLKALLRHAAEHTVEGPRPWSAWGGLRDGAVPELRW